MPHDHIREQHWLGITTAINQAYRAVKIVMESIDNPPATFPRQLKAYEKVIRLCNEKSIQGLEKMSDEDYFTFIRSIKEMLREAQKEV